MKFLSLVVGGKGALWAKPLWLTVRYFLPLTGSYQFIVSLSALSAHVCQRRVLALAFKGTEEPTRSEGQLCRAPAACPAAVTVVSAMVRRAEDRENSKSQLPPKSWGLTLLLGALHVKRAQKNGQGQSVG